MAITQIQDPFARGVGGLAGSQLGQVLSDNLTNIAASKAQQLKQQQMSGLYNQLGLPGNQLAYLPEQDRQMVLQELLGEYGVAPQQNPLMSLLMQQPGAQQAFNNQVGINNAAGQQPQPSYAQVASTDRPEGRQVPMQGMQLPMQRMGSKALARSQKLNTAMLKEAYAEQKASEKETLPYYKDIIKQAHAAKNNDKRLDRMEQLIKTSKLSNPTFASALKTLSKGIFGFGIDLSSLMNPESQEFEKLSNDFIREAKEIFGGGRLTDADLNAFLKIIPTLSLSNEGKLRVMENMRQVNEAAKIKENALKEIIKANGGKRPRNLELMVDEITQPQIDALADQFKRNYENVPTTESLPGSILGGVLPQWSF